MTDINLFYSLPMDLQREIFMMEHKDKKIIGDKICEELGYIMCFHSNGKFDYGSLDRTLKPSRVKHLRKNFYEPNEHTEYLGLGKHGNGVWEHLYFDHK